MPVISAMTVVSTTLGQSIGFIWKETNVVEKELNFKELLTYTEGFPKHVPKHVL